MATEEKMAIMWVDQENLNFPDYMAPTKAVLWSFPKF